MIIPINILVKFLFIFFLSMQTHNYVLETGVLILTAFCRWSLCAMQNLKGSAKVVSQVAEDRSEGKARPEPLLGFLQKKHRAGQTV